MGEVRNGCCPFLLAFYMFPLPGEASDLLRSGPLLVHSWCPPSTPPGGGADPSVLRPEAHRAPDGGEGLSVGVASWGASFPLFFNTPPLSAAAESAAAHSRNPLLPFQGLCFQEFLDWEGGAAAWL